MAALIIIVVLLLTLGVLGALVDGLPWPAAITVMLARIATTFGPFELCGSSSARR